MGPERKERLQTVRGYFFDEVTSAMQKAIRRGDAWLAGYWAIELSESNYGKYVWSRLRVIGAEDCWGILNQEIEALRAGWQEQQTKGKTGRIFISKAVILLCAAKKSRDADHLTNLLYDQSAISEERLLADLESARGNGEMEDIPEYAFDCHTRQGKRQGKTKAMFFRDEHEALKPRQPGLFDSLVP